MSESGFSPEQEVQMSPPAPAAPVIASITPTGRETVKVVVNLPTVAEDGGPLPSPLTKTYLFTKTSSFAGSTPEAERTMGTGIMEAPVAPEATTVEFDLAGLPFGTYYFRACVDM